MLRHNAKYTRVKEQAQEQVDVLVPHVSKLSGTNQRQMSFEPLDLCLYVSINNSEYLGIVFYMQW